MCNHAYTANYKQMPRAMGTRCPYPDLHENVRLTGANAPMQPLAVDAQGKCIFHSRDVAWKRDHDFGGHFLRLVQLLNAETAAKYYDFVEFVFVGDDVEAHTLYIGDTIFLQKAYFIGAYFLDSVTLEGVDFRDGADFRRATFAGDLRVANGSVRRPRPQQCRARAARVVHQCGDR